MPDLKPIHEDAIEDALAKAEHYRLLNEPRDAESICRDILRVDDDHQSALILLLLSLSDQFGRGRSVNLTHAQELLPRITNAYERAYFGGLIAERWAKSLLEGGTPGFAAHDWLHKAMELYEAAEGMRPPRNDDSILRWNACARILKRHDQIRPRDVEDEQALHQDM